LRLSGLSNTRVRLTADELRELAEWIDELLGPYVHRGDPPEGARDVRVLRYYLPS